ncbi:MAG: right-handed parallel beta-helix repeat-containing protein [Thermodesulfobacteriota bacterium]|nr:right-handed parallel beta-helix repeat-containing protein [Thermodesulfobacteriota bacterium]
MSKKFPDILIILLFVFVLTNHLPAPPECQAMDRRPSPETPAAITMEDNTIYQNGRAGLRIRGNTPVEVSNCTLYNNGRTGLNLEQQADVLVRNSSIHHNELGGISLNDIKWIQIENNKIHQNGKAGVRIRKSSHSQDRSSTVIVNKNRIFLNNAGGIHTIPTAEASIQLTVTDNTINGNKRGGIRVENNTILTAAHNRIFSNGTAGIASFAAESSSPFLNLYQNRIYFNQGSGIHIDSGVTGEFGISNNWIYNNHRAGISCGLWKGTGDDLVDIVILHNTIVANGSNDLGAGIRNDSDGDVIIYNNIVAYNFATGILNNNCSDASYNLLFANWETSSFDEASDNTIFQTEKEQYSGCSGRAKGDLITEPMFNDPDNYDFTLTKDSPARGAAKTMTSPPFSSFANDMGVVAPFAGKHQTESSSNKGN